MKESDERIVANICSNCDGSGVTEANYGEHAPNTCWACSGSGITGEHSAKPCQTCNPNWSKYDGKLVGEAAGGCWNIVKHGNYYTKDCANCNGTGLA